MATNDKLPNMPDVTGETVQKDKQLRNLLIAIKITLEKITGVSTEEELVALITQKK